MNGPSARRKAILWIAVVFVLGAALGGVGGYALSRRSFAAGPLSDEAKRAHMVERLNGELNLTGAQQQRLDQILTELQAQYKAIRQQSQPQIEEARHKSRNQVREILTPEQKPTFEDFLKRFDEKRRRSGRQ